MANGKLSWLNELLLSFILPRALEIGGDELKKYLEKAYVENPQLISTLLVSLYPFIDVYVETYAAQSNTKLDDKTVAELMDSLEEFANAHSIQLPNLDAD